MIIPLVLAYSLDGSADVIGLIGFCILRYPLNLSLSPFGGVYAMVSQHACMPAPR